MRIEALLLGGPHDESLITIGSFQLVPQEIRVSDADRSGTKVPASVYILDNAAPGAAGSLVYASYKYRDEMETAVSLVNYWMGNGET